MLKSLLEREEANHMVLAFNKEIKQAKVVLSLLNMLSICDAYQ